MSRKLEENSYTSGLQAKSVPGSQTFKTKFNQFII